MTYFFNELFFLQVFIVVVIALLFINVMPYTLIFLGLLFVCDLCLLLLYCGLNIFAIYLILVEIHVFYLLLCFTLTWTRYETVHVLNMLSSGILISGRVVFLILLILGFSQFTIYSINTFWFDIDIYTYTIVLGRGIDLPSLISGVNLNILTSLVNSFLTFNSFEFFLLNIIMFIAAFLYFFIALLSRTSRYLYETYKLSKILKFFRITHTQIRTTKQVWQLTRCASSLYKHGRPLFPTRKFPRKN